jgi:hypothetical protein
MAASLTSSLLQQLFQLRLEGLGKPCHHHQAGVAATALNPAYICQVYSGLERELLLRHAALLAEPAHVSPDNCPPVLHGAAWA